MLGDFLRAHREQHAAPPPAVGERRRRTPGLRREELAATAGVSTTWLTWLEQGRDVQASAHTLARLASALDLTPAERASLFDLARRRDPALPDQGASPLPASLLALPETIAVPAYVLDGEWTARAWNRQAAAVFSGWLDDGSQERNLLRFVFCQPAARILLGGDWSERARRLVAEFRADVNRRPRDPQLLALITDLENCSVEFSTFWHSQSVLNREGGERRFLHPGHHDQRYRQTTLLVAEAPDCKLVCLLPAG